MTQESSTRQMGDSWCPRHGENTPRSTPVTLLTRILLHESTMYAAADIHTITYQMPCGCTWTWKEKEAP